MDLSWIKWTNEEIENGLPKGSEVAKALGVRFHTTGNSCGKGHKSVKLSTGNCAFCHEIMKDNKRKARAKAAAKLIPRLPVTVFGITI